MSIPTEGFNARYQPLYDRQKALEKQVTEAQAALDILKVDTLSSNHMLLEGQNLADRWPRLNFDEKRQIVEDLIEDITVGEEEVAINLLYFPFPQDTVKRQRNDHASLLAQ